MNKKLLEMLLCPKSQQPLAYKAKQQELVSLAAACAYPVREGIPVLLIEEARALSAEELAELQAEAN